MVRNGQPQGGIIQRMTFQGKGGPDVELVEAAGIAPASDDLQP